MSYIYLGENFHPKYPHNYKAIPPLLRPKIKTKAKTKGKFSLCTSSQNHT